MEAAIENGTRANPMSFGTAVEGAVGHAFKTKGLALMYKKIGKIAIILGSLSLASMAVGYQIETEEATNWLYTNLPDESPYPPLASFVNIVLTEVYDAPWEEVAKLVGTAMGAGAVLYGIGYYLEGRRYARDTQN
jgi:hypothetical protein